MSFYLLKWLNNILLDSALCLLYNSLTDEFSTDSSSFLPLSVSNSATSCDILAASSLFCSLDCLGVELDCGFEFLSLS